jgi:RNA polymerase sigma factor (sigma-70 family)
MSAPTVVDDATLARGVASGEVACLAAIYDRYAGPLLGFCQNMLRRPADAEDCLQDVFVIAATRLGDLREPERLRSWLYSVARRECLARLDRRNREYLMDDVPDSTSGDTDQPGATELLAMDGELAALMDDMSAGLSDRDRLLLELSDRQQLSGDELAGALGVSRATAYTLVGRARTTARNSIGALLVARTGRRECPELDSLLTGWDGQLTTLRRKQITRHIDRCDTCTEQRKRVATPLALLGEGTAFAAELVALRMRILATASAAMAVPGAPTGTIQWRGGWPPSDPEFRPRRLRWLIPLAILLILLLSGGGVVIGATHGGSTQGATAPLAIVAPTSSAVSSALVASSSGAASTSATLGALAPAAPSAPVSPSSGVDATTVSATAPSAPPTPTATPSDSTTSSSPSPSTSDSTSTSTDPPVWTVTLTTAPTGAATVQIDGSSAKTCGANTTCSYSVPDGETFRVTPRAGTFTSPASCAQGGTKACTLTITANTSVKLKNPAVLNQPG